MSQITITQNIILNELFIPENHTQNIKYMKLTNQAKILKIIAQLTQLAYGVRTKNKMLGISVGL